jgi:hypothetical protein
MPFSDPKRIAQTLNFEVENYVPWDLDEVILDYKIVDTNREGAQVLAAMASWDRLDQRLNALNEVGIDPRHVTIDAAALSFLAPPSDECAAILNLEESGTQLCVVAGSRCRWLGALERGTRFLKGTDATGSKAWSSTSSSPPQAWAAELRTALLSAEDAGAPPIDRIYLTGGAGHIEGLGAIISEVLGVQAEPLPLPPPKLRAEEAPQPDPEHSLCYGLALTGLPEARKTAVEFRRGPFSYQADSQVQARLVLAAVALVFVVALSGLVLHFAKTASLRGELKATNTQLVASVQEAFPSVPSSALLSSESVMSVMNEQVASVEERITNLTGPELTPLVALRELSGTIPANVKLDVSEYLVNSEMIRIQAKTDSFGSVDSIEAAILENPRFKGAQKSNVNKARNGQMSFTVTIPRNGSAEEDEG